MLELKLEYPATIRYRANQFAAKKLSHGRTFANDETLFLERLNAMEYIFHLVYQSEHIISVMVNGKEFWSKDKGFSFILTGLDDIGFDPVKNKHYSKQEKFIKFISE